MADLAKYEEVRHLSGPHIEGKISELLKSGWELITAKVVEQEICDGHHQHMEGVPHYILGKKRGYQSPKQIRKNQAERDRVDREGQ